jgi:septal ring-binding cell division protein DamX
MLPLQTAPYAYILSHPSSRCICGSHVPNHSFLNCVLLCRPAVHSTSAVCCSPFRANFGPLHLPLVTGRYYHMTVINKPCSALQQCNCHNCCQPNNHITDCQAICLSTLSHRARYKAATATTAAKPTTTRDTTTPAADDPTVPWHAGDAAAAPTQADPVNRLGLVLVASASSHGAFCRA